MAQIIAANSLIYIEDGNFGAGWYIIPPGFDIENANENSNTALIGKEGDDIFISNNGRDTLIGGLGTDTASYRLSDEGVTIDLRQKSNNEGILGPNSSFAAVVLDDGAGGYAAGDVLISIENLIGSDHNDTLIGDAGNNTLIGGKGQDTLAGSDGADRFVLGDVGDGIDTVLDFQAIDRVIVQRSAPLDQIYESINDLLEALGLTLETDEDRNNDGQNDTIIMSGTSELMILQNLEFELSLSNFEVEVI